MWYFWQRYKAQDILFYGILAWKKVSFSHVLKRRRDLKKGVCLTCPRPSAKFKVKLGYFDRLTLFCCWLASYQHFCHFKSLCCRAKLCNFLCMRCCLKNQRLLLMRARAMTYKGSMMPETTPWLLLCTQKPVYFESYLNKARQWHHAISTNTFFIRNNWEE